MLWAYRLGISGSVVDDLARWGNRGHAIETAMPVSAGK